MQVVIDSVFIRRVEVFADVDAEHASEVMFFDLADQVIHALVVKAQPVDHGLRIGQAEHPGFWISRLRPGCYGADLNETETQAAERLEIIAVLVQARRNTNRVGKIQAHAGNRLRAGLAQHSGCAEAMSQAQTLETQLMRDFRVC